LFRKAFAHTRHHARFYIAGFIGILAWGVEELFVAVPAFDMVIGGSAFFISYLIPAAIFASRLTPAHLRKRADFDDEGIALIMLITLAAIVVSFISIFILVNSDDQLRAWQMAICIASVPLGWLMLHTVMAFHYAYLYYTDERVGGKKSKECGGLEFPGTKQPDAMDFLYFSFVLGMTAQTSDVAVTMPHMRHTTLGHSIISCFYNTAILAFAINIAAGMAK
jgi:uncharacterized membrane protein